MCFFSTMIIFSLEVRNGSLVASTSQSLSFGEWFVHSVKFQYLLNKLEVVPVDFELNKYRGLGYDDFKAEYRDPAYFL